MAKLKKTDLATVLRAMAEHVETGDSYDGYIEYHVDFEAEDVFEVVARYRTGNTEGQGCMQTLELSKDSG